MVEVSRVHHLPVSSQNDLFYLERVGLGLECGRE
jgi:hypothetical protein